MARCFSVRGPQRRGDLPHPRARGEAKQRPQEISSNQDKMIRASLNRVRPANKATASRRRKETMKIHETGRCLPRLPVRLQARAFLAPNSCRDVVNQALQIAYKTRCAATCREFGLRAAGVVLRSDEGGQREATASRRFERSKKPSPRLTHFTRAAQTRASTRTRAACCFLDVFSFEPASLLRHRSGRDIGTQSSYFCKEVNITSTATRVTPTYSSDLQATDVHQWIGEPSKLSRQIRRPQAVCQTALSQAPQPNLS